MTLTRFSPDKIGGAVCTIIGAVSLIEALRLYPYGVGLLTGDHTFPGILGVLLCIGGIILLFKKSKGFGEASMPKGKIRLKMLLSIMILLIYCFLIGILGYFLSTLAAFTCLFRLLGSYRWIISLFFSATLTAVLYGLFIVLLKTPFPGGSLFF
ncbi:tripartite tricarboxylate transporter TctB family protein [Mesobacillus foraminis]|uniref:Putative tricarboxylic transport membrane protein n=1 Tax=Mesobacillus foraminis TaxID=279826 RepID=A0A4R2BJC8_9BACI|nr:tripartite tricarboxylate transporter TctB family protein [Mesobacillus foraminis]TCN27231.1 putative tricarboxylic transport membrane protein [Mesobacillus foraminis]